MSGLWCRWLLAPLALVVAGGVAAAAVALHVPDPAIEPALAQRQPDVAHGAYVAVLGDCVACHTAAGGRAFAGGLKFETPVGAIYSSNITPDAQTGIGRYDLKGFIRVMRYGVKPDGTRLYPAMPYTSYDKVSDEDLQDLFAYLQHDVSPVSQATRSGGIVWPLTMRWPLALWDAAFHHPTHYIDDPSRSGQWNRGAYLVQGLAHCGTCHTPRGVALQEKDVDGRTELYLSGASLDFSSPVNLRGNIGDGLGRWTAADIAELLKTGVNAHSAVTGPMAEVVQDSSQYMTDADVAAIAAYLKSLSPAAATGHASFAADDATLRAIMAGGETSVGGRIFMDSCAACHRLSGDGAGRAFPGLAGNAAVLSQDPSSLIEVILNGARLPSTAGAPSGLAMPPFGWRYDNAAIAQLATFLRASWGNHASAVTETQVVAVRQRDDVMAPNAEPRQAATAGETAQASRR
jgi:mono/diheme cytochrome c family protein